MVWFWLREGEELQLETMYDNDAEQFVVRILYPNGETRTERFVKLDEFRSRLVQLETEFERERWKNSGPPLLIPEGFPNRRLT